MTPRPMLDNRPEWLAPLSDPRNEMILSAAFDVFVEKGLDGATMADVAARARISKETLYNRFDSKEGLFYALLAWGARRQPAALEAMERGEIADPLVALRELARESLRMFLKPEGIAVFRMVMHVADRMPEVARVFDEYSCGRTCVLMDRIAPALAKARIVAYDDVRDFHDVFMGLLRGHRVHCVSLGIEPIPDDEQIVRDADRAVDRLLALFPAKSAARGR
ncbi:MAG: TetR/AcrR family transcriptional regulator [Alphaproteobacteria bacterium]|nr:TetR/AcrR family transcriptional regulator [Alphaproteobacteria bacterium]